MSDEYINPDDQSSEEPTASQEKRSHRKKPTKRVVNKISESTWELIEKAYVTGQMSSQQISARWGVNRRTLEHRIRVGNWVEKRKNFNQEVANASYDDLFDKEVNTLLKHANLVDDLLEVAPHLLNEIQNSVTVNLRSRVAAFKELTDAVDKAVGRAREVRGIKPGEASIKSENEKDGVQFVVVEEASEDDSTTESFDSVDEQAA